MHCEAQHPLKETLMNRKSTIAILILCAGVLLVWAPWLTSSSAESKVFDGFTSGWEGTEDGCGFNCDGCGITASRRGLLGYEVDYKYGCGMGFPGQDLQENIHQDQALVTVIGFVVGLDIPR